MKYLKIFLYWLLFLLLFYFAGAFTAWQLNPGMWAGDMRLIVSFASLFVFAVLVIGDDYNA